MNKNQIFEELNIKYKSFVENNESNPEDKQNVNLELKACDAFYQTNKNAFNVLQNEYFNIKLSQLKSLEDRLVTLSGHVVDIFEPEITDAINVVDNKDIYALYGQLAPQAHFDFLNNCNGIEHTEYRDLTILLVFLDLSVNDDLDTPNSPQNLEISNMEQIGKKFPVVVYTFEDREAFRIGQKLKISGYFTLDKIEEPESTKINNGDEEHNKGFRDQYQPDKIHSLYSLNIIKDPFDIYLENFDLQRAIDMLKTLLLNIFKDKDAVTSFLIGLISRNYHKAGTEPLEYLNVNIYNVNNDIVSKIMDLFKDCAIDHDLLKIDHDNLKSDILAEHDTIHGIMKFNKIYPGSTTNYFISELGLSEGKLTQKATLNIFKLKEMIEHKQIWVTFYQSMIKFDLNTAIIGLSASKSIFPYDMKYKLEQPDNMQIEEEFNSKELTNIKLAVMQISQNLKEIKIEDMEGIKEKYVVARKNNSDFNQTDFSTILKISKHIACIELKEAVDTQIYEQAERLYFKVKGNSA